MSENSLELFVLESLPVLDEILSSWGTPIRERPLLAANLFVDKCIVEIRGDTKDNHYEKWWFSKIYKVASVWYRTRFPNSFKDCGDKNAIGVVVMYGVPFEVQVPLFFDEPEDHGKKLWVVFPKEVLPHDDVMSWVTNAPNLKTLSHESIEIWENKVKNLGNRLRAIHNNIGMADLGNGHLRIMLVPCNSYIFG